MQSNFEPSTSNMLDEGFDGYSNMSAKRAERIKKRKAKRADKKAGKGSKKGGAAPVAATSTEAIDTTASKEAAAPTDSTKTDTKGASTPPDADTTKGGDSTPPPADEEKFLGMPKMVGYAVVGLGVVALGVGAYFLLRSKPSAVAA